MLMKKILLILFCSCSITSFSQNFDKGDKLIGGSLSFSVFNANNSGPGYYHAGNAGILPSYSWFVKNNLAMGLRGSVGYSRTVQKFDNGDKRINQSLTTGVAVFFRKYKFLKEKFGIYFDNEAGGNYNSTSEINPPDGIKNRYFGASYQFSPGVFYKFSKRFIGEGNIGGVYASYFGGQGIHNVGIGATFLQYFNLGINYLIEKKKS